MKKKLNWHWIWFQGIVLVAGNSHRIKQYCYVMSAGCTAQGHFSWLSWLLVLEQKAFLLLWQKSKWQKISICKWEHFFTYRISANSFRGNYSFLNMEIVENSNSCRKFQFFYLINWNFAAETIQGRKQFKGKNYLRKYGMIKIFFAICIGHVQSKLIYRLFSNIWTGPSES